jgi:hypothetical protein
VLADVAALTLLLHRRSCASDDLGHLRFLAAHLRSARVISLPGADELWFVGDLGELLDAIGRFVDASRPEPS